MRAYLICTVGCSWCDVHLVSLLPTLLTKTRAFFKLHVHIHTYSRYYFPLSPKNCFIITLYFISIQLREFIFGVGWSFYCLKSFFQGKKFFNLPFPCHHIHEMMIIFPKTLILFFCHPRQRAAKQTFCPWFYSGLYDHYNNNDDDDSAWRTMMISVCNSSTGLIGSFPYVFKAK